MLKWIRQLARCAAVSLVAVQLLAGPAAVATAQSSGPDGTSRDRVLITATGLFGYQCDPREWRFLINHLARPDQAPASIQVELSNGSRLTISRTDLQATALGYTAHYTMLVASVNSVPVNAFVVRALAEMGSDWTGQFVLDHAPCPAVPTRTPVPTATRTPTPVATRTPVPTRTPEPTPTPLRRLATFGTGTKTVHASGLGSYRCDYVANEWIFVLDGLQNEAQAPLYVEATWDYGASEQALLAHYEAGRAYYTTEDPAWAASDVRAIVPADWSGQFYVEQGTCRPIIVASQNPELGSIFLFGSGALGMAGYALARVSRRRS